MRNLNNSMRPLASITKKFSHNLDPPAVMIDKLVKDSQKLNHFNILTVKNNTILDSDDFKCLDKISSRK